MRQVDLDELTYHIFSGLRAWTPSVRAKIFAPMAKRYDVHISIASDQMASRLRCWLIIDPANPEVELPAEQLAPVFYNAVLNFPGAIPALWATRVHEREREAQAAAAILLTRALDRFEFLSDLSLSQCGVRVLQFPQPSAPNYAFAPSWP